MSFLYVIEQGSRLSIDGGHLKISYKNDMIRKIPKETIEAISIFGRSEITTPCIQFCLEKGIPISYFSNTAKYFGRLTSTSHKNITRLKQQLFLTEDSEFCLGISKKIIKAKINNQKVILRNYKRSSKVFMDDNINELKRIENSIDRANTIEELMGYEGYAARSYFDAISKFIKDDFKFKGRSKRPPKDAFNSMLSLGYTILMHEIYGELENRGLSPYGGFMHKDRERHPTLASDLVEEWRAILVDATVINLIQREEVSIENFIKQDNGGVLLEKSTLKKFLKRLEEKMNMSQSYLSYQKSKCSYRHAIWSQIGELIKAIENKNPDLYEPIRIR